MKFKVFKCLSLNLLCFVLNVESAYAQVDSAYKINSLSDQTIDNQNSTDVRPAGIFRDDFAGPQRITYLTAFRPKVPFKSTPRPVRRFSHFKTALLLTVDKTGTFAYVRNNHYVIP